MGEAQGYNFQNKLDLLEAELASFTAYNERTELAAENLYASSIRAASSGNLSHEEGLACEYCAYHFQRMNDHEASLQMFERAKAAFQRWGSQVKVDNMQAYILVAREKVAEKD